MAKQQFDIVATFPLRDGTSSVCEMSGPLEVEEFFARLKAGFLQWRRPLSSALHSLSVFAPIPGRDESYRTLIEGLCDRWNADPEIGAVGPCHVELALTNRGDSWIGCSTAKDVIYKMQSEQGDMHLVDYVLLLRDLEAQVRQGQADERERRRAHPVKQPIELPRSIASEIAQYLRLEFGESTHGKDRIKARDLSFEGEFVVDGVPTQFWRYPTSNPAKPGWATVERFEDSYCLGMTSDEPPGKRNES